MTSEMVTGLLCVFAAAVLQGVFLWPQDYVREWTWERSWLAFSFFGMLVLNWLFAFGTLPHLFAVYGDVPASDLVRLALFGFGWGVGAVLFGIGMARLGLSLGYPIIMGLIASLGAFIPLLIFFPKTLLSGKGAFIAGGMLIVVLGIVLCSKAAARKSSTGEGRATAVGAGLLIAIAAGILSCLPNVGMTLGQSVIDAAQSRGAFGSTAANAVWAIFFTAGFVANAAYCLFLIMRNAKGGRRPTPYLRNLALTALMGLCWIASFYGYGIGAEKLGSLGPVIGWPLFIAGSIVVGNLVGLWRGEWRGAPSTARALLNRGIVALIAAVLLIAASTARAHGA